MSANDSHDNLDITIEYSPSSDESGAKSNQLSGSGAKVFLARDGNPCLSEEMALILRGRLAAFVFFLACIMPLAVLPMILERQIPHLVFRTCIFVFLVGSFNLLILKRKVALSLFQLRMIEMCVFCLLAIQAVIMMVTTAMQTTESGSAVDAVASICIAYATWSILILLYGFFIPNTWKRAALVLFPAAALPLGTYLFLSMRFEKVHEYLQFELSALPSTLPFISALAAVYGTHVTNVIRKKFFRARQFGQYRLLGKLGEGGMGEVYEAEHLLLKRPCAIKLIKGYDPNDTIALQRFEQEVRTAAKLSHWNTIEIFDYGRTETGIFYYVMELLPGLSLNELVEEHGRLAPERAVHFMSQTCDALREAHSVGLIHRDIKPANIFAAHRGGVQDVTKLLDFGLVKRTIDVDGEMDVTKEGAVFGSPLYMSPEQATGSAWPDARSDIYSLGAVGYFLLTARPPFSGKTALELVVAHARDDAVRPSELSASVPADLEQVVLKCMSKDPLDRYPDVDALQEALLACDCAGKWNNQCAAEWWREIETTVS